MHISEGVVSPEVLLGGAFLTLVGTAVGLKKMRQDQVPMVGILTAAFFVASLVHVPIGPANVHLVLNGLVGLLVGWSCFPAILIALLLQTLFFQFGGLTVLGLNTLNMAFPALLLSILCRPFLGKSHLLSALFSFLAGAGALLGSGLMVAASLALSGKEFFPAAQTAFLVHVPIMFIEGFITLFIVQFIKKVRPEMFGLEFGR